MFCCFPLLLTRVRITFLPQDPCAMLRVLILSAGNVSNGGQDSCHRYLWILHSLTCVLHIAVAWRFISLWSLHVEILITKVMVLGDGVFGMWLGCDSRAFRNGINVLRKEVSENLLAPFPCEDTMRSLWPGKGSSLDHVAPLVLVFQPLELWEIHLYSL